VTAKMLTYIARGHGPWYGGLLGEEPEEITSSPLKTHQCPTQQAKQPLNNDSHPWLAL